MSSRFFCHMPITGSRAVLDGAEAHHLLHVMRARPGDRVTLFDGSGDEFAAEVTRLQRSEVELAVLQRLAVDRELPGHITLGVSLPKGDRQKWLVEKAVELGIATIVPLETERSVAQPGPEAIGRLRRSVIEASKQCGRNKLLHIEPARPWQEFVMVSADLRWVAHPDSDWTDEQAPHSEQSPLHGDISTASTIALAVGPEGGLTNLEVRAALACGWQRQDLGPRILRIETAALLLAARAAQLWERRPPATQK